MQWQLPPGSRQRGRPAAPGRRLLRDWRGSTVRAGGAGCAAGALGGPWPVAGWGEIRQTEPRGSAEGAAYRQAALDLIREEARMRGSMVAVVAMLVAGAPAAAQHGTNHRAALLTHQREALAVAKRLQSPSYAELKAPRLKSEQEALRKHLDAADAELAELQKTAKGAEAERLEKVATHEKEARAQFDLLAKTIAAQPNGWRPHQPNGPETYAHGVVQHLNLAIAALRS